MTQSEDIIQDGYKYSWNPDSDLPLQDFLTKYKPSMVQNDGTKPWIWMRGSIPTLQKETGVQDAEAKAVVEASILLKEITEKVEAIKNDASIPMRSNKKTGAKSKKEVREEIQADATEKLKEISLKHGYIGGKWLIFVSADKVDTIWSNIARSIASGPLASTQAQVAKVATSNESQESGKQQHLICIYIPNVYDKVVVTEVMKILLRNHGVNLSGVKSDLYTVVGIDSKHPSGIPSTIWKNSSVISDAEAKELKDAYFADLASKPTESECVKGGVAVSQSTAAATAPRKAKLKLKKKADDDPFASDNDDADKDEKRREEIQAKIGKKTSSKKIVTAESEGKTDEAEHKKQLKAVSASTKKRQASDAEDDSDNDSEEDRPKKRKLARSRK